MKPISAHRFNGQTYFGRTKPFWQNKAIADASLQTASSNSETCWQNEAITAEQIAS
jgi:hypothetical protein